jgi:hypothetical protein
MADPGGGPDPDGQVVLDRWSARKIHPLIALFVAGVFLAMMAFAHLVVHSMTAVKALAVTAFGSIVAIIPGVLNRVEYRMTGSGIEKRTLAGKDPGPFEDVVEWDRLSHVVPTRSGVKYFTTLNEKNRIRRFFATAFSDAYSGELHIERTDRDRILEAMVNRGLIRRTATPSARR